MKRFTETCKWDDPWFRALSGVQKLVFFYVIDRCNNAGFWEKDEELMSFHTKLKLEHIQGAWQGLNRGLVGAGGWVWVRRFLRHQKNECLNPDNNAHKQIIALIAEQRDRFSGVPEFDEFLAPIQGLFSPYAGAQVEVEVKVKKESAERKHERPTLRDAIAYGQEIGMAENDVSSWFDHFEANGWKVGGKTPMRDWRAALRNGKRMAGKFAPAAGRTSLSGIRYV